MRGKSHKERPLRRTISGVIMTARRMTVFPSYKGV